MPHYRKKPVVIEARQYVGAPDEDEALAAWCGGELDARRGRISVPTREGKLDAGITDWIIKGVAGEFYPCGNKIFLATYDGPVEVQ